MTMKLNILNNMENESISAEVESTDSIGDLILFATQYWNKKDMAYVMKIGNRLIPANCTVEELGLTNGDTVVLVPDPQGG